MPTVALFIGRNSYRARAFLVAARSLDVDVVVVSDHRPALPSESVVHIDQVDTLADLDAVVAVDDWGLLSAALLAARLGLPHHPPHAVATTLDKRTLRDRLRAAGLPQPGTGPPYVVKPYDRSAGEGVMRADSIAELATVRDRVQAIAGHEPIVEGYVAGVEVIIEGIVRHGTLEVLATFDKPGASTGPTFPETVLVAPSRHATPYVLDIAQAAVTAVGLTNGPTHIEIIVTDTDPVVLEVHGRSIGGLCSAIVGTVPPLERLIVAAALGRPLAAQLTDSSRGVLMIPVERTGTITAIGGVEDAQAIEGVTDVSLTAVPGQRVMPLPERGEYLGFVFARGATTNDVERSLRLAWSALDVHIT